MPAARRARVARLARAQKLRLRLRVHGRLHLRGRGRGARLLAVLSRPVHTVCHVNLERLEVLEHVIRVMARVEHPAPLADDRRRNKVHEQVHLWRARRLVRRRRWLRRRRQPRATAAAAQAAGRRSQKRDAVSAARRRARCLQRGGARRSGCLGDAVAGAGRSVRAAPSCATCASAPPALGLVLAVAVVALAVVAAALELQQVARAIVHHDRPGAVPVTLAAAATVAWVAAVAVCRRPTRLAASVGCSAFVRVACKDRACC
eukprot:351873-Chlamydomonas_euryale.AAC.4